ncbi:hypothetical protein [Rhodococcus sp. GA1]|uniref:hypothetical protein n=1 Tax=Rhodococcus sp. GA1 TaxID=2942275 RepID=UPI0020CF53D7|nr:hypothetical protein [Rhodococcus sp. GA1]
MSFVVVLMLFNLLATVSAIVCATRSYRRYGSTGRVVLAGLGGLMILPLLFVLATVVATPRATRLP